MEEGGNFEQILNQNPNGAIKVPSMEKRLAERGFRSRGEPMKEGEDKGRVSLCRWRGGEGGRRGLGELGLQTWAGRVVGCQWKGRRGFVGYRGGGCVEGFP